MPVYNERTVVDRCISRVLNALPPENLERELVIVDGCSIDGTYDMLQRLATDFPQIPHNREKGAAARIAIKKAVSGIIAFSC
jgi:glycosyltransferase involved in cell wall biosynthesis